jgi:16S rRNA A1518/A1519 N6-dimethyltransferase RsmA/KsgA/DIM1 with predicted DNA glycosylase/AP lyase activity
MKDALDLLALKPGETMVELGSGDGRMLRAVAERGVHAIGYELNPLLVAWSRLRHRKYRRFITVHWGNYWRHKLPETDAIYVFLLNPYMDKLDKKITQEINKKVKLVSFAFAVPGKKPAREQGGMMLYEYNPRLRQTP